MSSSRLMASLGRASESLDAVFPLSPPPARRDTRIDFFRGVALAFIFIDHIPRNFLANATLNGLGFCDAASVFVFLAGLAAALAYGAVADRRGLLIASTRVWRRAWQLYVAHVFLFMLLTAQVAYGVRTFQNPMFFDEMGVGHFMDHPDVLIVEALLLRYQPTFLDILPLYIVLLAFFPLALAAVRVNVLLALVPSFALYLAVQVFGFNLPRYPGAGHWTFNPFAWQILIVAGAACGELWRRGRLRLPHGRVLVQLLGALLLLSAVIRVSWTIHWAHDPFPGLALPLVFHLGKSALAPLRLLHFLALTLFITLVVPPGARWLEQRWAKPLILCGQHSLEVFCLGVLLSVLAHLILVELGTGIGMQIGANVLGLAAMAGTAALLDWYRRDDAAARAARPAPGEGGR